MKRKIFSVLLALVLVCSFSLVMATPAYAEHALTPGGSVDIDADTNGGVYTALNNIVFTDLPGTDLADTNTFYLTAPTGFEFDNTAGTAIGAGYGTLQIDIGGGAGIAASPVYSVSDTVATWTVTVAGTGTAGSITISGMEIRPTAATTAIDGTGEANVTIAGSDTTFDNPNAHPIDHVPGAHDAFTVVTENAGTEVAGVGFTITLEAIDQHGNVNNDGANLVTGAVDITWDSTATNAPNNTPPTPIADGNQTFALGAVTTSTDWTLTNAGETPIITAALTSDSGVNGSSDPITVNPGALDALEIVDEPAETVAGVAIGPVTVEADDQFSNPIESVAIAVTEVGTYTFDAGTLSQNTDASGIATFGDLVIETADVDYQLHFASGAKTVNSALFNVIAAAFAEYTVVPAALTQTAGSSFEVTITVVDEFQNTSPSGIDDTTLNTYTFSFSGPGDAPYGTLPTYPTTANFTSGAWSDNVTLVLVEIVALTVEDDQATPMSGISADITVNPATAASFVFDPIVPQDTDVAFSITITAYDEFENEATGYAGTAGLTDLTGTIAPTTTSTFVSGTTTESVTVTTARGANIITATDDAITGDSGTFNVYDTLKDLNDNGWTLISTDDFIIYSGDNTSGFEGSVVSNLIYRYIGNGFLTATVEHLKPVEAIYVKTTGSDGQLGLNYDTDLPPGYSLKNLAEGWNLIGIAGETNAATILTQLRYATVGQEQGVGLAAIVSLGDYNLSGVSFYMPTLDDPDWVTLDSATLDEFDGYWVYMNIAKSFGVFPSAP